MKQGDLADVKSFEQRTCTGRGRDLEPGLGLLMCDHVVQLGPQALGEGTLEPRHAGRLLGGGPAQETVDC